MITGWISITDPGVNNDPEFTLQITLHHYLSCIIYRAIFLISLFKATVLSSNVILQNNKVEDHTAVMINEKKNDFFI